MIATFCPEHGVPLIARDSDYRQNPPKCELQV